MTDDQTVTTDDVEIRELTDPVATAIREIQLRVEDKATREARRRQWCGEFDQVLMGMFPNGPIDQVECPDCNRAGYQSPPWRDSDGKDCRGHDVRDQDGYDRAGYDINGWNRDGLNAAGERRDDLTRFRFTREGFDQDGYNRDGANAWGFTREQQAQRTVFAYDADGTLRDVEGYDSSGYNREGAYLSTKRYRDYN